MSESKSGSKLKSLLKRSKKTPDKPTSGTKMAKITDSFQDFSGSKIDLHQESDESSSSNHAKLEISPNEQKAEVEYPFGRKKVIEPSSESEDELPFRSPVKQTNNAVSGEETAAWEDPNDQQVDIDIMKNSRTKKLQEEQDESVIKGDEYSKRLRKFQQKVTNSDKNELYKWAFSEETAEEESKGGNALEALFKKTNTKITASKSMSLPKRILDFKRLAHVNENDSHSSVVSSVKFHPTNNLMLSAGLDKRVKLFNVNHEKSVKVQNIFVKDLPIYSASFISSGKEILFSGARKHFYYYDLAKNDLMKVSHIFGNHEEKDLKKCITSPMSPYFAFLGRDDPKNVMVMSVKTKQLLFDLKITSGALQDACFSDNYVYTVDSSGNISQFDLRTRQ